MLVAANHPRRPDGRGAIRLRTGLGTMTTMATPSRSAHSRTPSVPSTHTGGRRAHLRRGVTGWLFLAPAALMYAVFVLRPLLTTIRYSFYDWDGISVGTWVGPGQLPLRAYRPAAAVLDRARVLPDHLLHRAPGDRRPAGRGAAAGDQDPRPGHRGPDAVVPAADHPAAPPPRSPGSGCTRPNGTVNQLLSAIGLESLTRAWLGDFDLGAARGRDHRHLAGDWASAPSC